MCTPAGDFLYTVSCWICFASAIFYMTAHFFNGILFCLGGDNLNRHVFHQHVIQKDVDCCWHLGVVSCKEFHANSVIN